MASLAFVLGASRRTTSCRAVARLTELARSLAPFVRLAVVVDDFDVVAVGVEYVGGVVAVVVAGALTRLAVAAVSGSGRVGVEAADVVVVAGERDVDVLRRFARDHGE